MNLEGWQAGLVFGAAFTIVGEVICRAVLFRLHHRNHEHCAECDACLAADGLSVAALPKLEHCPKCLDTWPEDWGESHKVKALRKQEIGRGSSE